MSIRVGQHQEVFILLLSWLINKVIMEMGVEFRISSQDIINYRALGKAGRYKDKKMMNLQFRPADLYILNDETLNPKPSVYF